MPILRKIAKLYYQHEREQKKAKMWQEYFQEQGQPEVWVREDLRRC